MIIKSTIFIIEISLQLVNVKLSELYKILWRNSMSTYTGEY